MVIIDDGIRLNATFAYPHGQEPGEGQKLPLVIIIHGFTGHKDEPHLLAVSEALTGIGCATLRMDMYGHGASDGAFRDHTLFKWMTNAMAVVDYAKALPWVSAIYLCGHSQGGLTAILTAALKRDVIKGLIPLSPATMIPEIARTGSIAGAGFDPDHIPEELPIKPGFILGGNYIRVAQTIRVEDFIDRYQGPVLIVHGEADQAVPVRYAIEAAERYRHAALVLLPDDDHGFNVHLPDMVDAVRGWMRERLAEQA